MELRQLRYFTAVAEESTFVGGARRLGVAQPALTRQIHALEHELDVELLERTPKGVRLTPAGDVALASARHILREVDDAAERARGSGRGVAGRCVLCAGARSLASGLIGRIVERVRTRFPLIELGITEKSFERQMRALQLEEADIGLGFPAPPEFPDLASRAIDYDVFEYVALATSHRLARRRRLSLADLTDETFVGYRSDVAGEYTRRVYAAFARAGFTPARVREYDHVFAVAAAVEAGQGWTLLHREGRSLAARGTKFIPLSDFKLLMPHALVWRHGERRPVVFTVMEQIRHLVEEERAARDGGEAPEDDSPPPDSATPPEADAVQPSAVLELRHLRYFCSVVEAGSFGRAAEQLGLTQPSLSRQVAALERAVAIPLLERVARGVSATPAGESFFRSAKRILDEVRMLAAEAQRARRGVIARCVVASVPSSTARELFAALLRECDRDLHDLELVLADVPTPSQPAALRAGNVDLGVCHASPLEAEEVRGIERSRLTNDLLNCALVSEASPLARRREIALRDLSDMPFIFPDRAFQPALYDEVFDLFDQLEFQPRVDATYEGLRTIWTLVAEGQGWALGFASQCDSPPAGTTAVPIKGFSMPWGLDLLTRADESRSLVLDVADRLRRLARTQS
jgi:DNA-binding transcriptional LysR family regulator